ncbi:hypothetical protein DFE_2376 [Desulfovibrio ferrophilus]|uniref:Uncharacterized protein n=1 Tax=Desulfovibrio ferrophilus TaxID=241368 RepID=A0A2Z6B0S3_9BACT|nr:hypothetical protein DFE_2376 [Desulfovibrio ferrophilus]
MNNRKIKSFEKTKEACNSSAYSTNDACKIVSFENFRKDKAASQQADFQEQVINRAAETARNRGW